MTKITSPNNLLTELRALIEQARQHVALTVNSTLTMLYWHMGQRIQREALKEGRAEYGNQILATLSQELVRDYGKGFNPSALTRMVKFAEVFPDEDIVATLSRQLSWSHFVELLPLDKPLQPALLAHRDCQKARGCRAGRDQPPARWWADVARHGVS
jgi:DUF1016 N-terminal domain